MTSDKNKSLVGVTIGVLVVGTFLEAKAPKNTHGAVTQSEDIAKRLLAIGLLAIVLSFTVDQAPEFGGPLAILIMVAYITSRTKVFSDYFNQTQGTK